jgi:subtilisin
MPGSGPTARHGIDAELTGRFVVVLSDEIHGDDTAVEATLRSVTSVSSIASTRDYGADGLDVQQATAADATVFAELGVAVVSIAPDQVDAVSVAAEGDRRVLAIEPERILHVIGLSGDYLRGYRDAASHLYIESAGDQRPAQEAAAKAALTDTTAATWGLIGTLVPSSPYTGQGVALAVLDTGFELNHPDFAGRQITAQSFVPNVSAEDGHGHGTHCVGTASGVAHPPVGPRYGVAAEAAILVGKVLDDTGSGTDTNILAGISWAIANGARVISMSLGADVPTVSVAYETAGQRALAAGTLIVAAAGNNANRRFGGSGFVGIPANSPSIMAVAAVDSQLLIADFSASSDPVDGGQVDIAGPGVRVYSSWPMPRRYNTISGTSMATPHVAGLAALWSQSSGATGAALWAKVVQAASRLDIPSVDVGAGLAQAPQ